MNIDLAQEFGDHKYCRNNTLAYQLLGRGYR